jgi:hypothetical protein
VLNKRKQDVASSLENSVVDQDLLERAVASDESKERAIVVSRAMFMCHHHVCGVGMVLFFRKMQIVMLTTRSELPHTPSLATCVNTTGASVSEFSNQLKSMLKELHMHSSQQLYYDCWSRCYPADLLPFHVKKCAFVTVFDVNKYVGGLSEELRTPDPFQRQRNAASKI